MPIVKDLIQLTEIPSITIFACIEAKDICWWYDASKDIWYGFAKNRNGRLGNLLDIFPENILIKGNTKNIIFSRGNLLKWNCDFDRAGFLYKFTRFHVWLFPDFI